MFSLLYPLDMKHSIKQFSGGVFNLNLSDLIICLQSGEVDDIDEEGLNLVCKKIGVPLKYPYNSLFPNEKTEFYLKYSGKLKTHFHYCQEFKEGSETKISNQTGTIIVHLNK